MFEILVMLHLRGSQFNFKVRRRKFSTHVAAMPQILVLISSCITIQISADKLI